MPIVRVCPEKLEKDDPHTGTDGLCPRFRLATTLERLMSRLLDKQKVIIRCTGSTLFQWRQSGQRNNKPLETFWFFQSLSLCYQHTGNSEGNISKGLGRSLLGIWNIQKSVIKQPYLCNPPKFLLYYLNEHEVKGLRQILVQLPDFWLYNEDFNNCCGARYQKLLFRENQ